MKKNYQYLIKYIKLILLIGKCNVLISFFFMIIVMGINIVMPNIIKRVVDAGIYKSDTNQLIYYCLFYIVCVLVVNGINLFLDNYYETLKLKVSTKLKLELFHKLSKAQGKYLSNQATGETIRILDNDIFQVESFGIDMLFELFTNALSAIVVFIILLKFNPILLVTVFLIQISTFYLQSRLSKKVEKKVKNIRTIAGKQSNLQEQFISNIRSIILTNAGTYFQDLYQKKQNEFVKESKKVNFLISCHSKFASVFGALTTIITYLLGGILVITGKMTMGELIAFLQYAALLIAPCMLFIRSNILIKQTNVSLERIYGEIDRIEVTEEKEDCITCVEPINKIEFSDISFYYYEDKKVLQEFNLTLNSNEVVAIVGESGCGKSTLLSLLYRIWEPVSGSILINSQPIGNYSIQSLRDKICIVSQDPLIFNDSIKENILLNRINIKPEEFHSVCTKTGLNSMIEDNSDEIGERGARLSGGQKQRISIARALLSNCDVLIMDEATSSLDNISQKKIMLNLKTFFKDKIVIIIAHRMEAMKFADRIIVMRNGVIAEEGDHDTLLVKDGIYKKMNDIAI